MILMDKDKEVNGAIKDHPDTIEMADIFWYLSSIIEHNYSMMVSG